MSNVDSMFMTMSMFNVFSVLLECMCLLFATSISLESLLFASFFLCLMNLMCNSFVLCLTYSLSFATMCFVSQSVKSDGNF
jgi:hypothetical protein